MTSGDAADTSAASPAGPAAGPEPGAAAESTGEPEAEPKGGTRGRWWEFPVLAIIAIAVAIVVKTFLVQPFYIPSDSMERTLHGCPGCAGDKILVNKPIYDLRSPHPGDIIVFSAPNGWEPESLPVQTNVVTGPIRWFGQLVGVVPPNEKDLVKRVIATGGQTVKCCDAQGNVEVSVSGPDGPWRSLDEPYVYQNDHMAFGPVTVPKGRLWVLGDHRGDSADSRYHCGVSRTACDPVESTVPVSSVIGKAFVIAWPPSRWRTLGTPSTFTGKASAVAASVAVSGGPLAAGAMTVLPFGLWSRRRRRR